MSRYNTVSVLNTEELLQTLGITGEACVGAHDWSTDGRHEVWCRRCGEDAFEHTCRHYLEIDPEEFLRRLEAGELDMEDRNVQKVLAMLEFY